MSTLSVLFFLIIFIQSFAQQYQVVKKDSSIIHGELIELDINHFLIVKNTLGKQINVPISEILELKQVDLNLKSEEIPIRSYKSPYLSTFFSLLLLGLGQYYNKDYSKGLSIDALVILGFVTIAYPTDNISNHLGLALIVGASLYSVIEAPIRSAELNRKSQANFGHLFEFQTDNYIAGIDLKNNFINKSASLELAIHF